VKQSIVETLIGYMKMNTNDGHFPALYKRIANNKVIKWSVYFTITQQVDVYITVSVLNGYTRIYTQSYSVRPLKQVIALVTTIWNKKKREGYKEISILDNDEYSSAMAQLSAKLTDADGRKIPMKAMPFKENKFSYPALMQPKLNGLRGICLQEVDQGLFSERKMAMYSNKNTKYDISAVTEFLNSTVNNISSNKFKYIYQIDVLDVAFDGELYVHGVKLQELRHRLHSSKTIDYYIFDIAVDGITQEVRFEILDYIFPLGDTFYTDIKGITLKDTRRLLSSHSDDTDIYTLAAFQVNSDQEAREMADRFIELGYEGGILRSVDGEYKFGKRSHDLMKFKRYLTTFVTIIDVIPAEQDTWRDEPIAKFKCLNDKNKKTFIINPEGTKANRLQILKDKDKYIGKKVLIKFFERTTDNVPFHANVIENPKL
jgi:hypothetical protein